MFTLVQTSELLLKSQTHFVRVVVELTGRFWRSLAEIHRGRASGQEVDAMRTHRRAQTSAVVVMQRKTPTAAQRRNRKVSVCNGARILPVFPTHRRTHTKLQLEQLMSILAANYCSSCSAAERTPPQSHTESANLTFHMRQNHPDALEQGRGFNLGKGKKYRKNNHLNQPPTLIKKKPWI